MITNNNITYYHKTTDETPLTEFDDKIKKLKNKNFSNKDISIILSETT